MAHTTQYVKKTDRPYVKKAVKAELLEAKLVAPPVPKQKQAKDPLTGLTGPEELFCREVLRTGSSNEAYRLCFPELAARQSDRMVSQTACIYLKRTFVQKRLMELRTALTDETGVTLKEHLTELGRLREIAVKYKQLSAAIAAETNRGKASGLYVEKVEHTGIVNIVASAVDERL